MKKVLLLMLILSLVLAFPLQALTIYDNSLTTKKIPIFKIASTPADVDIKAAAAEYLEDFRSSGDYEILGFTAEQFYGMQIGNPFLVYQFDTEGRNLTADIDTTVYTCPMVYDGKIIGVVAAYYNEETEQYSFAAYRDTKYENLSSGTVDTSKNLIVGNMDSTLFVTDGTNVDILGVVGEKQTNLVNRQYIQRLSTTLKTAADYNFVTANDVSQSPLPQVQLNAASEQTRDGTAVILNVPFVQQELTDNCACASWSAVLNYRFHAGYTPTMLRQELYDGAYIVNLTDGVYLEDLRDYTNWKYPTAGCVTFLGIPSFATVKNAILIDRPITGSWYRTDISNEYYYHTINIIGYREITSTYYQYYVVNPWHDHIMTIPAYNNSVVCNEGSCCPDPDCNYVWYLNEVLY